MFSAYCLSISKINLPKTVERTSENKNAFLVKDAAIVLTGSAQFSATCCCKYVSENLFSEARLPVKKKTTRTYRDATKWNKLSHTF